MWILLDGPGLSYSMPTAEASPGGGNGIKKKKITVKVEPDFPFSQLLMNSALASWVGRVSLAWRTEDKVRRRCAREGMGAWRQAGPGCLVPQPSWVWQQNWGWQGGRGPCGELEQTGAASIPPHWITCIMSPGALVRELDWWGDSSSLLLPFTLFALLLCASHQPLLDAWCWTCACLVPSQGPRTLGFILAKHWEKGLCY